MKLGLIIKSTSAGEQEVFSINKVEEWAKFAADSRSIIKDLEGFDGSGKSVIIAKIICSLVYLIGVVKEAVVQMTTLQPGFMFLPK